MRLLVTRPAAQAAEWVQQLRAHGIDAHALPLIEINALADPAPLDAAWRTLARQRLVVFVSPNAVQQFFAARPAGAAWPGAVLAGSPGPGTTHALRELGVARAQIAAPADDAAQFDSQALWAQLSARDWRGAQVLVVRGDGGREWLGQTLRDHGAHVADVAAYRRAAPTFDAAQAVLLHAALDAPAAHLWLFSSSQAIDHLAAATPGARWRRASAVASHPRIAARARALGFGRVLEARPALADVVACIQSIRP